MSDLPKVRLGRTGLEVTRIGLGGFPFGGVNHARDWDPFTPDGRLAAIEVVHAALEAGINYIDTAPAYGKGNSESIIGEALVGRRSRVTLATKVGYRDATAESVSRSVEQSLQRLRTDTIDLIQFHGGMYTKPQADLILDGGLLDALVKLRDEGKVRFLGFTVEDPWTGLQLLESGHFDVVQVRYNLIYQAAALHLLDKATEADVGVTVMRPMTSGILQRIASCISPEWQQARDLYEVALKFVLSDSRVHVANVGMRWVEEVERNVRLASSYVPPVDMADIPRMTAGIYQAEDEDRTDPQSTG